MTGTDGFQVTSATVIRYLLTLEHPILSTYFTQMDDAAHLLTERADWLLFTSLFHAQRRGLQAGFIDAEFFTSISYQEHRECFHGDFAALMLPGYRDIYRGTFFSDPAADTLFASRLMYEVMTHFGKGYEFRSRGVEIITFADMVHFINQPVVAVITKTSDDRQSKLINRLFAFGILFISYWIFTNVKTALTVTAAVFIAWAGYRSFKQFAKDVSG